MLGLSTHPAEPWRDPLARTRARRPIRRNWDDVVDKLNNSPRGEMTIRMGSPGSAQVTRVRLLAEYRNLEAHTKGSKLHLRIAD